MHIVILMFLMWNYVSRTSLRVLFIYFWCSVCVCSCVPSHTCLHVYVFLEVAMMLGVFLDCSPPYFLRQGLLLSLELSILARLQGAAGIWLSRTNSTSVRNILHTTCYISAEGLNLGPYSYTTSTRPNKPFPISSLSQNGMF